MTEHAIGMLEVADVLNSRSEAPKWSPPTGEQVRSLREFLGLTQAEFAEKFMIDLSSLRNWEQGRHVPEGSARQLFWMIQADPNAALRLIYKARKASAG